MKQVNKDEFYAFVMNQDAKIDIDESYSAIYRMSHSGKVIGKCMESKNEVEAAIGEGNTYFLAR